MRSRRAGAGLVACCGRQAVTGHLVPVWGSAWWAPAPRRGGPRRETGFDAGSSVGRRWAEPLAAGGQLHGRRWAGSHGRRQQRPGRPPPAATRPRRTAPAGPLGGSGPRPGTARRRRASCAAGGAGSQGARRQCALRPARRARRALRRPRSTAEGRDPAARAETPASIFRPFQFDAKIIFASSAAGRLREPRRRLRIRFSRRSEAGLRRRPRRAPNPIFASSSGARIRFFDRSRPADPDFRVEFRGETIFRSNRFHAKIGSRRERAPNDAKIIFASSRGRGGRHRRSSPRKPATRPDQRRRQRPWGVQRCRAPSSGVDA